MSGQNLFDVLFDHVPDGHGGVFLEHERATTTYAEARMQSARLAAVLRGHGVTPGARLIVQVAKSPEAVMLYLACLRVGAVFIPLNPAYTLAELRYFIDDARPVLVVCDPADAAGMARACPPETHVLTLSADGQGSLIAAMNAATPDDIIAPSGGDNLAAILYTSGTTGRSKGAMLSHGNLAANALTLHNIWHWQPGDVLLHALPIFHVHGLFVALHCALQNGSRVIFQNGFDADQVIARLPDATVMMGVPTYYTRLLERDDFRRETCANMRLFISGSAPLLPETFERFRIRTGHTILERYGMTEAGMIASNPYRGARVAGTVGPVLPDVVARVCDEAGNEVARGTVGVLEISGPNVFGGYWQMPDKTAAEFRADGFFITGDMAVMDDAGRISIVGRARDLVISGGFNVYPKEVEIEIDKLDGIAESAVIGVPHPDFGEAVVAVIVADGSAPVDAATIRAQLRDRLAGFKQPKAVIVASELPRNTMGKVQKKALRDAHASLFKTI